MVVIKFIWQLSLYILLYLHNLLYFINVKLIIYKNSYNNKVKMFSENTIHNNRGIYQIKSLTEFNDKDKIKN